MNKTNGLLVSTALAFADPTSAAVANDDVAAVRSVVETYAVALNAQDTDTIINLYAEDGVFMPQHSLPQVGPYDVRKAYERVFTTITLDVEFEYDEVETISDRWAYVRTHSNGTVTINATGESRPESNQELFLLRRDEDSSWKIARYIFSTTNPPRS